MRPNRGAGILVLAVLATGCASAPGTTATRSPSPSAPVEVKLPDFNSRLGSNRLAAEAGAALGRKLFSQGQYWEVYVRTQPATLSGTYDVADPASVPPLAAQVTATEVVLASESASAINAFGKGGVNHEKAQLSELDALLRQTFPALATDTISVFYGESFQHGQAVFDHGRLTTYNVRKLG